MFFSPKPSAVKFFPLRDFYQLKVWRKNFVHLHRHIFEHRQFNSVCITLYKKPKGETLTHGAHNWIWTCQWFSQLVLHYEPFLNVVFTELLWLSVTAGAVLTPQHVWEMRMPQSTPHQLWKWVGISRYMVDFDRLTNAVLKKWGHGHC